MEDRDLAAMDFDSLGDACSYLMQEQRKPDATPGYRIVCELGVQQIIDEMQHRDPQLARHGVYGIQVTRNRGKTSASVDWNYPW
jgi:hypothetical protein